MIFAFFKRASKFSKSPECIFLLTLFSKNLIYESHCDLDRKFKKMLGRINQ